MELEDVQELLSGGPDGVREWNLRREAGERVPKEIVGLQLAHAALVDDRKTDSGHTPGHWTYPADGGLVHVGPFGVNFRGLHLTKSSLREARLVHADFTGCKLEDVDLAGADLSLAIFHGAHLVRVNLTDALFDETILADVEIEDAIGLDRCRHLGPSSIDHRTLLDYGMLPRAFLEGCGVSSPLILALPSVAASDANFYSCFVSYSHADSEFTRRLHACMHAEGIRCWLDEHEVLPGDNIHDAIDRGIRQWDKVLLCCSDSSLSSWWVDDEVGKALDKERRLTRERGRMTLVLIPLDLDGYVFSNDFTKGYKSTLTRRFAPSFHGWRSKAHLDQTLVDSVVSALRVNRAGQDLAPDRKL